MQLVVLGLNHQSATVGIRENFSFSEEKIRRSSVPILEEDWFSEWVILSTCNRTELYAVVEETQAGRKNLTQIFRQMGSDPTVEVDEVLFFHEGREAISHLFEVSASLDSLVLGEGQILSQVKQAYALARELGATGTILNTLFNRAIHVGKKVRTDTQIAHHTVSISSAAVDMARQEMGDLTDKTVMIIGAGQMAELAAQHLVADGVGTVFVSNRNFDRARLLAKRFKGRAIPFSGFLDIAVAADIIITSTGAPHYIIKSWDVSRLMTDRAGKPLLILDIAVPRDVEPSVNEIAGVTLLNVDSLEAVVADNKKRRQKEAKVAYGMVEEAVEELTQRFRYLSYQPLLVELSDKADIMRRWMLKKTLTKLPNLGEDEERVLDQMTRILVRKILRDPILRLHQAAADSKEEEREMKLALAELFKLTEAGENHGKEKTGYWDSRQ